MKIAVSAKGPEMESEVDDFFGRCNYFVVVELDEETKQAKKLEAFENQSKDQRGGAGVTTSRAVVEKGATAVITGNLGPRAKEVLDQFDVKAYQAKGTVEEAVKRLLENELEAI